MLAQNLDLNAIQQRGIPEFKFAGQGLGNIVTSLVPYLFAFAGIILLLNLLWGGISLMLSGGDPKAIEAAKAKITTSLIGFIIIFVAYWLVQILATILRLETVRSIFG